MQPMIQRWNGSATANAGVLWNTATVPQSAGTDWTTARWTTPVGYHDNYVTCTSSSSSSSCRPSLNFQSRQSSDDKVNSRLFRLSSANAVPEMCIGFITEL